MIVTKKMTTEKSKLTKAKIDKIITLSKVKSKAVESDRKQKAKVDS